MAFAIAFGRCAARLAVLRILLVPDLRLEDRPHNRAHGALVVGLGIVAKYGLDGLSYARSWPECSWSSGATGFGTAVKFIPRRWSLVLRMHCRPNRQHTTRIFSASSRTKSPANFWLASKFWLETFGLFHPGNQPWRRRACDDSSIHAFM